MKDFKTYLHEGVYDPGIFKAFFMAGGPGSGKSFIASNTFGGTGLKFVNSDTIFELGLKKAGLSLRMPESESELRDKVRARSKLKTGAQLDMYIDGRLGLVIDATGRDYDGISKQYAQLKELGYDCSMVFVNTTLPVAMERNRTRSRSIPEYVVKKSWEGVQSNIGKFQRLFGMSNMLIVDNNKDDKELTTITLTKCAKAVNSLMRKPLQSYIAKGWIKKELDAKKRLNESIIDIPKKYYARDVFDDHNTDKPKLKPAVLKMIKDEIAKFEEYAPVEKYSLIGSILTKRYREDADLDINILFKVPVKDREAMRKALAKNLRNVNGKLVPGSKHPINYYVITDPELKKKNDDMADGVFDIDKNEFVRRPNEETFDPEKYESEFQKKVKEIDVVKGELIRDLIDYEELRSLEPDDVLNLQDKVNKKLSEIEDSIKSLVDTGDDIVKQRQDAFNSDMSPDQIREFGKKHKLPKNVVYKMLEKYHYLKFYKKLKDILEDDKITDDELDSIREATEKTIAFTFGRFNPPTIGHEKLIKKVASIPSTNYKIFLSRSNDPKKNPLDPREKLNFMKKMFPAHARNMEINTTNMILEIVSKLYREKYLTITMVVGSDRVREFEDILNKYNDVRSRHGYYNFNNIKVVSAGERDPDAEGATGMSASKMREAAAKGDMSSFSRGLPTNFREKEQLFKAVRKGMNLKDSVNHHLGYGKKPIASLREFQRDLYVREEIFNIGDQVRNDNEKIEGKVVRRGTNYVVLEDNNDNLIKSWIWDCQPITANRDVQLREHNLDVDYGFKAVSENEVKMDEYKDKKKKELMDNLINKFESYDIGHDYANHTAQMTPGQHAFKKNYQGGNYKPSNHKDNLKFVASQKIMSPDIEQSVTEKDVKEWASSGETIDKYRTRYGDNWQVKLKEDESSMKIMSFKKYQEGKNE